MNGYDPDANIMMPVGPIEEDWYRAGMAAHARAMALRETPAEMFVRVRRSAERVYFVRVRRQRQSTSARMTTSVAAGMVRPLFAALH